MLEVTESCRRRPTGLTAMLALSLLLPYGAEAQSASGTTCHTVVAYDFDLKVKDWYSGITSTLATDTLLGLHFNDQLFRATANGPTQGVIREISKNPESGVVTLKLDESCKWSNGRQITSADVKAGLEAVFSPHASGAIPRGGIFLNGDAVIAGDLPVSDLGIETPDETTVRFASPSGVEMLKTILGLAYYIPLPSWLAAENPDLIKSDQVPEVYSGPYVVGAYGPDRITLETNPHFCGARPAFGNVDVYARLSVEDVLTLATKEKDFSLYIPSTGRELGKKISAISWIDERFYVNIRTRSQIGFMRLNARSGPFQDHDLRRAFSMAIDWDGPTGADARLMSDRDQRMPSRTLLPPSYMDQPPEYPRDLRPRSERLAEARAILARNGYTSDAPLKLTAAFTRDQADLFYMVKEMVEFGLPIKIDETKIDDPGTYYGSVFLGESTDYDISLAGWGIQIRWPMFYIGFYYANNIVPAPLKAEGQPYLDRINQSSVPEIVQQAQQDAMQLLLKQDIFIPFFAEGPADLVARNVSLLDTSYASLAWALVPTNDWNCKQ